MKNYIQAGKNIAVPAPANVTSGDFILIGALGGVVVNTALSGADVPIVREGVFTLPKATGETWAVGDQLYWDATNKKFTKTSSGNTLFGVALSVSASGDTSGSVLIG